MYHEEFSQQIEIDEKMRVQKLIQGYQTEQDEEFLRQKG